MEKQRSTECFVPRSFAIRGLGEQGYMLREALDSDREVVIPLVSEILEHYKLPLLLDDGDRALTCLHSYYHAPEHNGQCWVILYSPPSSSSSCHCTSSSNSVNASANASAKAGSDEEPAIVGLFAIAYESESECELQKMFLRVEHRGKRIGDACLEYFVEEARARGFKTCILDTVSVLQPATKLYEKHGFRRIDACTSKRFECDIVMQLDL
eukprot:ANDGO_02839.mRNA.1 Acetyltransferase CD1211